MSGMSDDFLDSIPFLTPELRATLRSEDLDTAAAFAHVTVLTLQAPPFSMTLGKASRLLSAAMDNAVLAPPTITVKFHEPVDLRTRIERALVAAEADPATAGALQDLGVQYVVLGDHGKVWPSATVAMHNHVATGAPIGATWQGAKIVSVRSLSAPVVLCSPRTGRPLQDGKDEVTETPWGALGLDGLRVAAFGYEQGMFDGMSEAIVLDQIGGNKEARVKTEKRMKALDVKPEDMDRLVVFKARVVEPTPTRPHGAMRDGSPHKAPLTRGWSLLASLTALFLAMFDSGELRRFLGYRPGGEDFVRGLPGGNSSAATFANAAADQVIRHGWLTRDLRNALVAERPRRSSEIDAIFSAAGVL